MDRPEIREAYIREALREREAWLYQHALNKAHVITRSMKPEEKAAYLESPAFASTLAQVRRRDQVLQALCAGEIPLSWGLAMTMSSAPALLAAESFSSNPQAVPDSLVTTYFTSYCLIIA